MGSNPIGVAFLIPFSIFLLLQSILFRKFVLINLYQMESIFSVDICKMITPLLHGLMAFVSVHFSKAPMTL